MLKTLWVENLAVKNIASAMLVAKSMKILCISKVKFNSKKKTLNH